MTPYDRHHDALEHRFDQPSLDAEAPPTETERQRVLYEWNATELAYPQHACIQDLFEAQAARTPERVALISGTARITYRELDRRANQLAWHLRGHGVGPETVVGICVERSPAMIVGLLGILKAGGAYVPLDPAYPQERLAFMLEDSRASVLLTQKEIRDWRLEISRSEQSLISNLQSPTIISLDADWPTIAYEPTTNPEPTARPEHLAYVIYTSGSTGRPKGVAITHTSAVAFITWALSVFSAEQICGVLAGTSICFDLSIFEIFATLSGGGTIILAENVLELPELPAAHAVTLINSVPSAATELLRMDGIPAAAETINLAGEPLPLRLVQQLYRQATIKRVVNLYGPSEDTTYSTWAVIPRDSGQAPSIGRPIANTQVYLLDARMQPVAIGVPGELYLGGAGLARGYLGRPDLTAERFVPNPFALNDKVTRRQGDEVTEVAQEVTLSPLHRVTISGPEVVGGRLYRTGDLARYRPDGNIEFLGRIDQQVKVRGFRIELGEIQTVLEQLPAVRECVVVAREDAPGDTRLVAYLVPTTDDSLDKVTRRQADKVTDSSDAITVSPLHPFTVSGPLVTELRDFLKERLPEYMVPSAFVLLDALPLTPNGKIDRRALPAPDSGYPAGGASFVAPRTGVEQALAAIWEDVLGLRGLGVHDHFFEIGGHSLLAAQIISRCAQRLNVALGLRALFEHPTIASLAGAVEAAAPDPASALVPAARPAQIPLAFAQEQLWFFDRLLPGSPLYNIPVLFLVSGSLDITKLEDSLSEVVRRHESLRTRFVEYGGHPVQVVVPAAPVALEQADLRAIDLAERLAVAQKMLAEHARQPFDLGQAPLLRALLIRLEDREYRLLLTIHHIVFDGFSIEVLVRELGALYAGLGAGQPAALPDLPIQYADFTLWQHQLLQDEAVERHLTYWRAQLSGHPATLELPTDRPRPPAQTYRGARLREPFAAGLLDALERLSRQEHASLYMILLAAFQTLLYRYTGQVDIIVGTPLANRSHYAFESLIGFFINTLPLRVDLGGNPAFRRLLRQVRQVVLAAFDHQDLPHSVLIQSLGIKPDLSRNPLFQVLFVMQHAPISTIDLPDARICFSEELATETAKLDLNLAIEFLGNGPAISIEYSTDLFDQATIGRMLGHYQTLLAGILANADRPVAELSLLTEAEQRQVLIEWNAAERSAAWDGSIVELFEAQVARDPAAIALISGDLLVSYREVSARSNQLAHYLRGLGVGPETLVGVCLERSVELIVAILGVIKAGGAYLPLDPAVPPARLAFMLADSRAPLLITQKEIRDWRLEISDPEQSLISNLQSPTTIHLDADWPTIAQEPATNPEHSVHPEQLAYAIYTSGSTGTPKGVVISHAALLNLVGWHQRAFGVTAADRASQLAGVGFDAAVWDIWPYLTAGACVAIPDATTRLEPAGLRDWLIEQGITIGFVPTPLVEPLLALPWPRTTRLRYLLTGGDRLQQAPPHDLPFTLINNYGPTENTVVSTSGAVLPASQASGPPAIGRPIDGALAYVLDTHMQPVPVGVPGELYVGGAGLGRGYLGRPDLTAERFLPNPFERLEIRDWRLSDTESPISNLQSLISMGTRLYKTGDLVCYLPGGNLEFLGRIDQQVKLRGHRIELGEIEAALLRHPSVREVVVSALESDSRGKWLVAYLTLTTDDRPFAAAQGRRPTTDPRDTVTRRQGDKLTEAAQEVTRSPVYPFTRSEESVVSGQSSVVGELRAFLKERLPEYMIPAAFVVLPAFPLTPNGKVDRRALPVPDEEDLVSAAGFEGPRTPTEDAVAAIWAAVLRLERVSIRTSFFDLGGHSLLATQVRSRVREAFGVELPLRSMLASPTVAVVAQAIDQARRDKVPSALPLVPTARDRSLVPSFAQRRLWFIDQWESGSAAYNIPIAIRMAGPLDIATLRRSLDTIMQRHEALRTAFTSVDGQPVPVVSAPATIAMTTVDLGAWPAAEREATAFRIARGLARHSFDLAHGPLVRATLLRLGAEEHLLLLAMHHIVSDDWSMGVFYRELGALYDADRAGRPAVLPDLPIQYADFALWQQEWLQGTGEHKASPLQEQLAYWRKQLAGAPAALDLPLDRPRPPSQSTNGATHRFELPAHLVEPLTGLGRRGGATLFMVLLTAFQTLLYRYTGQVDLVVGSPIAGRTRTEIEPLIGFFVNMLVLRGDLAGNPRFPALLARLRDTCLEAFAHQDLPFERLVEELQPTRDASRSPLFQVVFALQNAPAQPLRLGGLMLTPIPIDTDTAKFDLTLMLEQTPQGLSGMIEYSTDLFEATTIAWMAGHFHTLLEGIAANPEQPIGWLPLLTASERQQLVVEWNDSAADFPRDSSFVALFEAQAGRFPDRVAASYEQQQISYAALNARANQLAHHLGRLGVGPDTLVGLCVERSLTMLVGMLGILKAGGAYLPLDPGYPQERLTYMLEDSGVPVVLTFLEPRTADRGSRMEDSSLDASEMPSSIRDPRSSTRSVVGGQWSVVDLERDWHQIAHEPATNPNIATDPDQRAYVIYTSGSTGRPKGVMVRRHGLLNLCFGLREFFDDQAVEQTGLITSISFDISVNQIFPTLLFGRTLHIIPDEVKLESAALLRFIQEHCIQLLDGVPSHFQAVLKDLAPRTFQTDLRYLLIGGEKVETRLLEAIFSQLGEQVAIVNIYGLTEISDINAFSVLRASDREKVVTVGRPLQNNRIYLTSPYGALQPLGVIGEVCVSGESLSRGYLNRPELTAEKFVPCEFEEGMLMCRTGDLGRRQPDGQIVILGRGDHQVKVRGFRIELGEIEALLLRHPAVREGVVVTRPDAAGDARLVAYLVPATDDRQTSDEDGGLKIEDSSLGVDAELSSILYPLSSTESVVSGQSSVVEELRAFLMGRLPGYMVPSAFVMLDVLPRTPNGKIDRRALPTPEDFSSGVEQTYVAPRTLVESVLAGMWGDALEVEQVGVQDNFFDLGGHSLNATRIVSRIRQAFQVDLTVRHLFAAPTVASLANHMVTTERQPGRTDKIARALQRIKTMSAVDRQKILQQKSGAAEDSSAEQR